jgi:hypothetical protein
VTQHHIRRPNANGNAFLFDFDVYEATRVGDECGDSESGHPVGYGLNTMGCKSIRHGDGIKKSDSS